MARAARFLPVVLTVVISLSCVCPIAPPSPPAPVGTPTVAPEAPEEVAISSAVTDSAGRTVIAGPTGTEFAIVDVRDADSEEPIAGIDVYLFEKGSRYLVVAVDPEGRYLASWREGFVDELGAGTSSKDALESFVLPSAAHAQALPVVLILLKVVSAVSSLEDLAAYLQDPPDYEYWGVLYEERCWTGEQLANYVGAAGLVIPGGKMEYVMEAIFLMSQHVIEEDLKEYFRNLERPMRVRTYHLGIPFLGMVPVGWCDEATRTPTSTPTLTPPPTRPRSSTPIATPSLTGGRIAFQSWRGGSYEVYVMNANGSAQTNLTNNAAGDGRPSWSPDGTRIAFQSNRDGNSEIYVMNADGAGPIRLTDHPATDWAPSWSSDSGRIAFMSDRDGNDEIYIVNADGSGVSNLTNHPSWDAFPSWSPNAKRIAFESDRDGPSIQIYTMNADGSEVVRLTNIARGAVSPSWSREGAYIAFGSGDMELYKMNADGSGVARLTNNPSYDQWPSWSPDGTQIAFVSDRDGNDEIYVMNADGTGVVRLTNNSGSDRDPSWSPK